MVYFKCDGCGEAVDVPKKVGHIVKREYCERCAEIADRFVREEEELRKATQERFVDDRALLIVRFSAANFRLPDIP